MNSIDERRTGSPAKTLDGKRTDIADMNLGSGDSVANATEGSKEINPIRRWWRNLNLVMAGMYTGLSCYGTPHERHRYPEDAQQMRNKKKD